MIEQTPIGLQHVLSGAERDPAGLARKLANEPLRPTEPQLPCDQGLFSDSHKQGEMFK